MGVNLEMSSRVFSAKKWVAKRLQRLALLLLKPVYKLYEKWLWLQIKDGPFPLHIGIIPDGNRRWAREVGIDPKEGHFFGYEKLKEVLRWIWDLKIKSVTIYAMSTENCTKRDPGERISLFNLALKGIEELASMEDLHKYRVKVKVVGNMETVPPEVREAADKIVRLTSNYDGHVLNIALCYGGRHEIIEAVKKIVHDVATGNLSLDDINEELFVKYLMVNEVPDVDLIIRTSGEERISNFLLWQSAYSELYFCDTYWPEFRKIDFWRAIRSYQKRERRFGR